MEILTTEKGVSFGFDPDDYPHFELFDPITQMRIGGLEVDDDDMFVGAELLPTYQRKGIATAFVRFMVETYGYEFSFWTPDGNKYEDTRHLSTEGAAWASKLVKDGLAKWVGYDECCDDSVDDDG